MLFILLSVLPWAYSSLAVHTRRHSSDRNEPRHALWVHAYARSGSSTVLSMFAEAWPGAHDGQGSVFSLFEPCHKDDVLAPGVKAGCGKLLTDISRCDFSDVISLHGWNKSHSNTRGVKEFDAKAAHTACAWADLLVFKTIAHPNERYLVPLGGFQVLKENHNLKMVEVLRDPRSIYTSMLTTPPFSNTITRDVGILHEICNSFAAQLKFNHPRVLRILFEDLVADPESVMRKAYEFAGAEFGNAQIEWINSTFKQECNSSSGWQYHDMYTDCHSNPTASLAKWRTFMTEEEINSWKHHPNCVAVSKALNYVDDEDTEKTDPQSLERVEWKSNFPTSNKAKDRQWWKPAFKE